MSHFYMDFVESSYVKEQTISALPEFWEILLLCSPHWFQPLMIGHDSFFIFTQLSFTDHFFNLYNCTENGRSQGKGSCRTQEGKKTKQKNPLTFTAQEI